MTREEILSMEPGIELDKLVSVHVMGWEVRKEYLQDQSYHEVYYRSGEPYENANYPDHWQPSQYIDAAWEVEEKIKELEVQVRYTGALKRLLVGEGDRYVGMFDLIHASPSDRCKAALLAILPGEE